MPATRIIDKGMMADAALQALATHQWLTAPDFDQEGKVQRAERALADTPSNAPVLLSAAQAMHRWLDRGEKRPPTRVSTITLFDGIAITDFDGLPASASRWL